ncbi:o-succinylbenzoate synthase [Zhouia spongiae]|uniref:O-succinylbenzoate synthase n=1 Tax=Zhouia spongiae TaxID=2202721 RepID=A0ABY3YJH3_9FLAO|nr:o-succinylbenzoate synthase [Zhouia spongiae]UNY97954.1 o-succinylbenzoate synthase [Zhouia spongiae]
MTAAYRKYILDFKRPSGTSRGVLNKKETWFVIISKNGKRGIGECGVLRSLSIDDTPDYEEKLKWTCDNIHLGREVLSDHLKHYPSIQFGLEQAFLSLESDNEFLLFPSDFTLGKVPIEINGLIWMGEASFMKQQIKDKLEQGFRCIKMKIGAIDFDTEINLLRAVRKEFSAGDIELRVDANGAFLPDEALEKLKRLSQYELHSIEQPIKQGQPDKMAMLCEQTPLPIALDEELIGVFDATEKRKLIQTIRPQFIILKPSLVGGYRGSEEWIDIADNAKTAWWVTSALESNIGLNAIAQWTYALGNKMPQGLGTGALYTNNFDSPLEVKRGRLHYNTSLNWKFNL